jgi:uncharacterized protein (TIGR00297 family)
MSISWGAVLTSFVVSGAFALLARQLRGVTRSGGLAGAGICFVLYASAGARAFLILVLLFSLTWMATRAGYRRKQSLGTAENREGRRASQVLANLGAAAVCAIFFRLSGDSRLLLAFVSALSEAGADTVSSEIGQSRSQTAIMITSWKSVPSGTDGGVSLWGTLAGVLAAALIAVCASAVVLTPWHLIYVPVVAAVGGMIADSFLGAMLEQRGWLNNDAVNFLSTCVAVGLTFLLL